MSQTDCQIVSEINKDIVVVKLSGKILFSSVQKMKKELSAVLKKNDYKMVLDLEGLTFTDSSGLTLLISLLRQANENGGDIKLLSPPETIHSVLKITKLTEVFEIFYTLDEAIAGF